MVWVGDLASIDRLIQEMRTRRDAKLVYVTTSLGRLKVIADNGPLEAPP